jgi:phosphoserine phosphatase
MTPLPSWNSTPTKQAIFDFVTAVTTPNHPDYVPPAERIACFDNDGTLWCERPLQIQFFFLIDQIRAMAAQTPTLSSQQPFKAVLEQDIETVKTFQKEDLMVLFFETHTGMSPEEFQAVVKNWFAIAQHPRFQRPIKACVFQPMVELLDYLRSHQFKTFIVSGGGIDFIRAMAEELYGIPPEQVIGSNTTTRISQVGSWVQLVKQAALRSFNDREEKVHNIYRHIGRRPILAVGNSDGDLAMLRYTAGDQGRYLPLLLHHDDAEREDAYDRDFHLSPLTINLTDLPRGSLVISMKRDFARIFPQL